MLLRNGVKGQNAPCGVLGQRPKVFAGYGTASHGSTPFSANGIKKSGKKGRFLQIERGKSVAKAIRGAYNGTVILVANNGAPRKYRSEREGIANERKDFRARIIRHERIQ